MTAVNKLLKIAKQRQGNKYLTDEEKQSYFDSFAKPCQACAIEGKTTKAKHDVFGRFFCEVHFQQWREKVKAMRDEQNNKTPNEEISESK